MLPFRSPVLKSAVSVLCVVFSNWENNISVSRVRTFFTITTNLEEKRRCCRHHHQDQHLCTCAALIFSSPFVSRIICREKTVDGKRRYLWEFSNLLLFFSFLLYFFFLPHLNKCISFLLWRSLPLFGLSLADAKWASDLLLPVSDMDQISTLRGLLWHNLNWQYPLFT